MNLTAKLKKLRDQLVQLKDINIYHYRRPQMTAPYLVWQETGEGDSFEADNGKREQPIAGTLDYYTRKEYDDTVDEIQDILEDACSGWSLLSVQYEEKTEMIHYEWEWELV